MLKVTRNFAALGLVPLLAGCMSDAGGQQVAVSRNAYTVSSVQVNLVENAKVVGRFEDAALRKTSLAKIDATVEGRAKALAGGSQDARAVLQVTEMQLRNSASRTFGGVNAISGQVTIFDAKGNKLKGPTAVRYSDQAKNNQSTFNGIPIGLLVNAGRNSSNAESGADVDTLIAGFADKVTAGL